MQATVASSGFPFLGGIGRFVPNPRLGGRPATLNFIAGYGLLRENAMAEWREAAHLEAAEDRRRIAEDATRRSQLQPLSLSLKRKAGRLPLSCSCQAMPDRMPASVRLLSHTHHCDAREGVFFTCSSDKGQMLVVRGKLRVRMARLRVRPENVGIFLTDARCDIANMDGTLPLSNSTSVPPGRRPATRFCRSASATSIAMAHTSR